VIDLEQSRTRWQEQRPTIDDVKRPRTILFFLRWVHCGYLGVVGISRVTSDYALWKYSGELVPGMTRNEIENRLISEGIGFFPETPDRNFVSVSVEVQTSLACAPRAVGLLLEFEMRGPTSSGSDVLRNVRSVRRERGCL